MKNNNKMKILKIILINIFIIFIILFIFEIKIYKQELKSADNFFKFTYPYSFINTNRLWDITYDKILKNEIKEDETGFRITEVDKNINIKKAGIIIFGCSFAYGSKLGNKDTISYYLSKYTKRPVYNRAFSGWGIQGMLYQLEKNDFVKSLKYNIKSNTEKDIDYNNIQYVIYIFIDDHLRRLVIPCSFFDNKFLFYKKNSKTNLLERKSNIYNMYWHSYIWRKLYRNKFEKSFSSRIYDELLYLHFKQSNLQIKKLFPNAKFIILVYNGDNIIKRIENNLNNENIEVLYLSDLSNIDFSSDKYSIIGFNHPTGKAWETVSKLLVDKLNL